MRAMPRRRLVPLITRDPATDEQLVVTRLEGPTSGIVIEGAFDLGWIGRLTPEQLDFVGLLLRTRTNLQKLADELGVAYNTVRARLDEVVEALGAPPDITRDARVADGVDPGVVLERLAAGEVSVDEAVDQLRGLS
jgi:hypothetical protein